jgi:hypothetical protein
VRRGLERDPYRFARIETTSDTSIQLNSSPFPTKPGPPSADARLLSDVIDQPLHRLLAILPPLPFSNLVPFVRNPLKTMCRVVHHSNFMLDVSLLELLRVGIRLGRRDELIARRDDEKGGRMLRRGDVVDWGERFADFSREGFGGRKDVGEDTAGTGDLGVGIEQEKEQETASGLEKERKRVRT